MKQTTLRKVHTWVGLCATLFFLCAATTGILLTFRGFFSAPSIQVPVAIQQEPALDPWEVVKRAETLVSAKASSVSFSNSPDKPIRIRMRDDQRTTLYYSTSGILLKSKDRSERSFNGLMWDIHTGAILGRPGELFVAFVGTMLLLMSVTGFLIWPFLVRRQKQKKKLRFTKKASVRWSRGLQP